MARNDANKWTIGAVAVAVAVTAGFLIWSNAGREPGGQHAAGTEQAAELFDPQRPVEAVHYMQAVLVPAGQPVALKADEVAVAGTSDEGFLTYAPVPTAGGGGGQASVPQRYYVRTTDGRYQPLAWR